jgi:hypothetical protein
LAFALDSWALVGLSEKHTGAVVDLVVDDHVEVFLWGVVSSMARDMVWKSTEGNITLEVCSDTSLKVNSLDISSGRCILICVVYGDCCKENGTLVE